MRLYGLGLTERFGAEIQMERSQAASGPRGTAHLGLYCVSVALRIHLDVDCVHAFALGSDSESWRQCQPRSVAGFVHRLSTSIGSFHVADP